MLFLLAEKHAIERNILRRWIWLFKIIRFSEMSNFLAYGSERGEYLWCGMLYALQGRLNFYSQIAPRQKKRDVIFYYQRLIHQSKKKNITMQRGFTKAQGCHVNIFFVVPATYHVITTTYYVVPTSYTVVATSFLWIFFLENGTQKLFYKLKTKLQTRNKNFLFCVLHFMSLN